MNRLPNNYKEDPTAIEVLFCDEFKLLPRYELDSDLFGTSFQLARINEKQFTEEIKAKIKTNANGTFIYDDELPRLLYVAISAMKYRFSFVIDDYRLLFALCFIAEVPGILIAYLTYLQYWSKKSNTKTITFKMFMEEIFPHGLSTNDDISWLLDNCKLVDNTNLLDYQSALQSIHWKDEK